MDQSARVSYEFVWEKMGYRARERQRARETETESERGRD